MFKHAKYGTKVYSIHGLDFYVNDKPAKRTGKDRLWLQIRQNAPLKKWQVAITLAYSNAVDICLEKINQKRK